MPPVELLMDTATLPPFHGERLSVPEKVIVAPCIGQFRAAAPVTVTAEGEVVAQGDVVGYIDGQGQVTPVRSAFAGWMMGLMAHDGERVREGQPVAWLRSL
jgi:biotin carboxyl carrier protein